MDKILFKEDTALGEVGQVLCEVDKVLFAVDQGF